MTIAYLNEKYMPLEKVMVPAMDRGFLFGDGVYEVIPIYNNRPFRLEQHISRLAQSLQAIALQLDLTQIATVITQLIAKNPSSQEQGLYLQVTRGASPYRDHKIPAAALPTVFAYCMPIASSQQEVLANGIKVITVPDIRWERCDIKSINLLPNIMMKEAANKKGAFEAIFIRNEKVMEGTSMNFFMIRNQVIITPPLSKAVLGGITRELVLQLAMTNGMSTQERDIDQQEIKEANEIWLTSSTKEIVPVISIDDTFVNGGVVGPMWTEMMGLYSDFKNQLLK